MIFVLPIAVAVFWFGCGWFSYHITLGEFTRDFPWMDHRRISQSAFLFGFVSLICQIYENWGNIPWLWKPKSKEEMYEIFKSTYPSLSRQVFEDVQL